MPCPRDSRSSDCTRATPRGLRADAFLGLRIGLQSGTATIACLWAVFAPAWRGDSAESAASGEWSSSVEIAVPGEAISSFWLAVSSSLVVCSFSSLIRYLSGIITIAIYCVEITGLSINPCAHLCNMKNNSVNHVQSHVHFRFDLICLARSPYFFASSNFPISLEHLARFSNTAAALG